MLPQISQPKIGKVLKNVPKIKNLKGTGVENFISVINVKGRAGDKSNSSGSWSARDFRPVFDSTVFSGEQYKVHRRSGTDKANRVSYQVL